VEESIFNTFSKLLPNQGQSEAQRRSPENKKNLEEALFALKLVLKLMLFIGKCSLPPSSWVLPFSLSSTLL
jgi:hypothetical protein